MDKALEIMLCFDEVFSAGGYSENCKLEDIIAIQAADSKEEKLYNEISKSKEKEAKEELRRKARLMKQRKGEELKTGIIQQATDIGKSLQMSMNLIVRPQIQPIGNSQPYISLDRTSHPLSRYNSTTYIHLFILTPF